MEPDRFYRWFTFPYAGHRLVEMPEPPQGVLSVRLTEGRRLELPPEVIQLAIITPGIPMDFGATPRGIVTVSERGAEVLRRVAPDDVQLIPARIAGTPDAQWVANIVSRRDCVDPDRSSVEAVCGGFGTVDVASYVIDPARTGDSQLFRLHGDLQTIIVAERLKRAIFKAGLVGPGLDVLGSDPEETLMPGFPGYGNGPDRN